MSVTIRKSLAACAVVAAIASPVRGSAAPEEARPLTPRNDAAHALMWSGLATIAPAGVTYGALSNASATLGAQSFSFVPRLGSAREARATLWIHWDTPEDLAVTVWDHKNHQVAASDAPAGADEVVAMTVANGAPYEVRVIAKVGVPNPVQPQYQAALWVRALNGMSFNGPHRLAYTKPNVCGDRMKDTDGDGRIDPFKDDPPPPCYFRLTIPINIVYVGFDKDEVDSYSNEVLAQLPRAPDQQDRQGFRPVILNESKAGGGSALAREGGTQVRQATLQQGSAITYEPFEYNYKFNIITADEKYSRALFAAAKAATTQGEFAHASDRASLERYNAASAAVRRSHPVVPGSPVDFIDAMKLEDWVAAHPPKGVGSFNPLKPATGYTYFVIDSYRPAYAGEYFNLSHFHNFRVMNDRTVDPDTGAQRGFDWGRVWGGRYRFMMQDVGAAPNAYEALATAGPGDSSALDPPVWEYVGCVDPLDCRDLLPLFYGRTGENVLYAMWMRFTRGYSIRPVAADRYLIASNTWHDSSAYAPLPSRLDKLYSPSVVQKRLRELLPFAPVEGSARVRYLSASDVEQAALSEARGQTRGGAPAVASTNPVMRLIEQRRSVYAPLRAGTATIPVVNAVFPGRTTWDGSDETKVTFEGADAFGVFSSVDDVTKWDGATATVKDSAGVSHAPIGADPRGSVPKGTTPAAAGGFTAGAIRGVARMLGLFPPTEGVAYAVMVPGDLATPTAHPARPQEQYRAYYRTFDPMFATTATPLSNAFQYNRFEILDKDTLWIGQSMELLAAALDEVADAFAALDSKGYTQVTPAVTKAIVVAGKSLGECVGSIQIGLYGAAVTKCRAAKVAMAKPLLIAIRTVVASGDVEPVRVSAPAAGTRAPASSVNPLTAPIGATRKPAGTPWLPVAGIALGVLATVWAVRPRRRAAVTQLRRSVPPAVVERRVASGGR